MTHPWLQGYVRIQRLRDAIASVALSHEQSCECDICKAARGDEDVFARLLIAEREGQG